MRETVRVEAQATERMTLPSGWAFWRVRTGCVRVQKGDFTAYLQRDEAEELADFIQDTDDAFEERLGRAAHIATGKSPETYDNADCGCRIYADRLIEAMQR